MRSATASVHIVAASVGFTSLAALWLCVMWGMVLRNGWATSRVRHATLYGTHMVLAVFGLTLGLVHAIAQLAVPNGPVGLLDEIIPFGNHHDPIGIGVGVIALELMLTFILSVLLQRRMGYHRWRSLHSLAYLAYALLVGHVLISGSDVGSTWARTLIAGSLVTVLLVGLATLPKVTRLPRKMLDRSADRVRSSSVSVNVDPGRCARFGFCEHEAPSIFTLRSDGRLAYRASVPGEQVEAAVQAAMVCPARAIKLGRLPTSVVVAPPPQDNPEMEQTGRHHLRPIGNVSRPAGGRR